MFSHCLFPGLFDFSVKLIGLAQIAFLAYMDDSINHYISASFSGNRTNIYLDFSTLSETSRKRQILLTDDECLGKDRGKFSILLLVNVYG